MQNRLIISQTNSFIFICNRDSGRVTGVISQNLLLRFTWLCNLTETALTSSTSSSPTSSADVASLAWVQNKTLDSDTINIITQNMLIDRLSTNSSLLQNCVTIQHKYNLSIQITLLVINVLRGSISTYVAFVFTFHTIHRLLLRLQV